ncbi:MAG: class I SAM-dependent methyltransferase [Gammaproteobacteria bacterium]|nr:class I SAM-dependent methyltransferase [Gammaproteobacteria bacterium]
MNSKEFGLVASQQLLQIQDLHYGFWEDGEAPSAAKFPEAQSKYTDFLCQYIREAISTGENCRILDVGCGIGVTTYKLLDMGYRVDGLVPSNWMAQQAREKIRQVEGGKNSRIYECNFEDFPVANSSKKYQLAFFSESYQYVNMQKAFDVLNLITPENGTVIIFDFFKKDGVDGESPLGGGHSIGQFYHTVEKNSYKIHTDLDVTNNLSPNLKLVNDILVERIIPFSQTLDTFFSTRYYRLSKILKFLFRKKLEKVRFKYSQGRNEESFRQFKTYRLFVLKRS